MKLILEERGFLEEAIYGLNVPNSNVQTLKGLAAAAGFFQPTRLQGTKGSTV